MAHILPYSISVKGLIYQILQFPIFMYILGFFKELILSVMKTGPVPLHIGLIMDGNRRYAKQRELALKDGHTAGAESLMEVSTYDINNRKKKNTNYLGTRCQLQARG